MTIFILPILIIDLLLLIWIMGHLPRQMFFPELNIPVLLMVPFIIGVVIYYDLKGSFGLFDTSEIPLLKHMELYFLFSMVFLGTYALAALAIIYHDRQPQNDFYYDGIKGNIKLRTWPPVVLHILFIGISILGILRFYFDHELFR